MTLQDEARALLAAATLWPWTDGTPAPELLAALCDQLDQAEEAICAVRKFGPVPWIKWGGGTDSAPAVVDLGYGIKPFPEGYGLRKALWDAAYGYINGFPITAIAYYTLTRSLHWRIHRWAMKREGFGWDDDLRMPIVYMDGE